MNDILSLSKISLMEMDNPDVSMQFSHSVGNPCVDLD